LDEISFDEPVLNEIMNEVFSSPTYKVRAKDIMEKYELTREAFEESMLLLEFNLVCCLSYNQTDENWEEVITPFYEWREFLRFAQDTLPDSIKNIYEIQRTHPHDFGFVQDMTAVIDEIIKSPISVEEVDGCHCISDSAAKEILSHPFSKSYIISLIEILKKLQLIEVKDGSLHVRNISHSWKQKHLQEQAIAVYRYGSRQSTAMPGGYIDRDLRETEKCLKRFMGRGWVYFEDFLKGCCAPIGDNEPVRLVRKGKRWRYQTPTYSNKDKETIYQYLFHTLFYAGLIATGTYEGKDCFCVTPFGRMTMN